MLVDSFDTIHGKQDFLLGPGVEFPVPVVADVGLFA
ncbi:hypothetical protein A2U01_0068946, partial [Trifolium medium]|nr:hypothetical protein [Trifolium medium]